MGVLHFFWWLCYKYPQIIEKVNTSDEFDNLYLDMNGIIHICCNQDKGSSPATEEEMMMKICDHTERIFDMIRPQKVLYIAIDGVAPRAKMNQQRSRRFRSAQEAQEEAQKRRSRGQSIDTEKKSFDSNCITPGTLFMAIVALSLRNWIAYKLNNDPGWSNLKVILSDASVPGEGEHKITQFIRVQRASNPNTRHVIYGSDSDLIFLALATHEPHFRVLRENQQKSVFDIINVQVFREYLKKELEVSSLPWSFNLKNAIDDWVFLSFFVGNDFLPHIPFLDIKENAIDNLITIWKRCLPSMGGYLTNSGDLDLKRLQNFITELDNEDKNAYIQWYKKAQDSTKNTDDYNAITRRYYEQKFKDIHPDEEFRKKIVKNYIEGLFWTLEYYRRGVPSWTWYYPYGYSPFASDLINMGDIKPEFKLGKPFKPFEQLMFVLPPYSKELLPLPYQKLITDESSEIKKFYPESFEIDKNGKKQLWQGVVLLPFIDESLLLKNMKSVSSQLKPCEIERNSHGFDILLFSNKHELYNKLYPLYLERNSVEIPLDPIEDKMIGLVSRDPSYIAFDGLSVRYRTESSSNS
ncbi:11830_t:CDS:10 [Funneliformis mosseae]|uniref:11830_t:CDS:1 n=1 Tax=Funneliformis mosseae TaxID=27381 RepID=A0A9N9GBD7_FUNMO|nr:11830_t:CDS:10 [Funneliformis mosseae]